MKKQTISVIITHFLRTAFILVLLVLAVYVMPGVVGQQMSKEAVKAEAAMKESARADVPLVEKQSPQPAAPQVCTLDGILGTAPVGGATGNLAIRLFRGGVVTSCASAPYPGTTSAATYIYNVHYITNPTAAPLCTNVTLHYVSGGTATVNFQVAAFQSPFAPADIATAARYLGDPGSSSGNPPIDTSFSVNVPASATIGLVVFNTNASPQASGAIYQINLDQDAFCGPPAPNIAAAGSTLTAEGCLPANSAIDPGEMVTVDLKLMNNGGAPTTSLVATLLATGGVTAPSGPQNYGVIAPGGMTTKSFSFTADSALACGATLTATLQLLDNGNPLPNVTFNFATGALVAAFSQNFDSVVAPALPAGWTADLGINTAGAPLWETSNAGLPAPVADSAPNAAFSQDPNNVCDNRIYTPVVMYTAGAQLIFKQNYDFEQSSATVAFDCGVLEMNTNGAGWVDILTAGGVFAMGGYNHTDISTTFSNPLLPTRPNWSGISNGGAGGFETCAVNLPAAGVGQMVQFRWRMGSDNSVGHDGWRVDTVSIANRVCCSNASLAATGAVSRKVHATGSFDIALPLTGPAGLECRGPAANNNPYQIVTSFANNITTVNGHAAPVPGDVELTRVGVSLLVGSVTSVSISTNTVIVNLTGVATKQRLMLKLKNVADSMGSSGDIFVPMNVLIGDTNASGNGGTGVSSADVSQVKAQSSISAPVTQATCRFDVNVSGATISSADVSLVKSKAATSDMLEP